MPASTTASDAPSVPLSFSNCFWGTTTEPGVDTLLGRMQNAKTTCDELKTFYNARAALEDEYARKLFAICRKPLGSTETGTLRSSLDVARGETEAMGKQHASIAQQMKSELEEPLAAFAGGMKERRKIVQTGVERLLKTKQAQTAHVNKSRDKYEQDCLRIKGYLAQGHMVMGQEERKNKAKLEKTQINMATNSNEYEAAVKVLEETTGRWNKEWKAACDKFQDLEEERLDFTKSSLWAFANIASTVCVSDDASCEKVRLSLENCEVEKDIADFIRTYRTGQEIPDPPRYINFCRGDVDSASEVSEDDNYSVAQFQRTTKPEFRTASPSHSTTGPGSNAQSELAQRINEGRGLDEEDTLTSSKSNSGRPAPLNYRQQDPNVPPNYSPSQHGDVAQVPHNEYPTEGMTMFCRTRPPSVTGSGLSSNTRPSSRDSQSDYSNPTSYTSADPMSGKNSPTKSMPPAGGIEMPGMASSNSPDRSVQKKRSGFFSNSPFRRKSKRDTDDQAQSGANKSNRNTWNPSSASSRINLTPSNLSSHSQQSSPTKPQSPTRQPQPQNFLNRGQPPEGEEAADPRASFQLNVGNNLFDVASPDSHQSTPKASMNIRRGFPGSVAGSALGTPSEVGDLSLDPIAQALAELKSNSGLGSGLGMNKQASTRVQADRYHGVQTPAPDSRETSRPVPISARSADRLAAQRGTPPPAYDSNGSAAGMGTRGGGNVALGVPQPAFTSREMRSRTENWGTGSQAGSTVSSNARPGSRQSGMRSRSPGPGVPRATSPSPQHQQSPLRARSPGPGIMQQQGQTRARSPAPVLMPQQTGGPYPHIGPSGGQRPRIQTHSRNGSGTGMEIQLSSSDVQRYDQGSGRSRSEMRNGNARPSSAYGDPYQHQQQGGHDARGRGGMMDAGLRRERSKSMAAVPVQGHGAPRSGPLHHARALYSYSAAIPEELSFTKGDTLAVLRLQDDGWWEAEVSKSIKTGGGGGRVGLVPSNYLQRC